MQERVSNDHPGLDGRTSLEVFICCNIVIIFVSLPCLWSLLLFKLALILGRDNRAYFNYLPNFLSMVSMKIGGHFFTCKSCSFGGRTNKVAWREFWSSKSASTVRKGVIVIWIQKKLGFSNCYLFQCMHYHIYSILHRNWRILKIMNCRWSQRFVFVIFWAVSFYLSSKNFYLWSWPKFVWLEGRENFNLRR